MNRVATIIRDWAPHTLHCAAISVFNYLQYRVRFGGEQQRWKKYYQNHSRDPENIWKAEQLKRLRDFLNYVKKNSAYFKELLKDVSVADIQSPADLASIPLLDKETLFNNLKEVVTVSKKDAVPSKTGGTTGNSLEVLFLKADFQERFGFMEYFWGTFGYARNLKAIWLSGKELLSARDLRANRYFKDDYINKIRYLSTFHLNRASFPYYWRALNEYGAKYIFGFPSVLVELCAYAKDQGLRSDAGISHFFSTSEVISNQDRQLLKEVLGCRIVDQYASAEGAPFITECPSGRLHLQPLTGVFEVLDSQFQPARKGELVVTSFTTRGTPLLRYRIGDSIEMEEKGVICDCGSSFPIVKNLGGRTRDYIYRDDGSRINSVNISNSSKGVVGLIRFQVIQEHIGRVTVRVVAGESFSLDQERVFVKNLKERLGDKTVVDIQRVSELSREKSGKVRMLVNKVGER